MSARPCPAGPSHPTELSPRLLSLCPLLSATREAQASSSMPLHTVRIQWMPIPAPAAPCIPRPPSPAVSCKAARLLSPSLVVPLQPLLPSGVKGSSCEESCSGQEIRGPRQPRVSVEAGKLCGNLPAPRPGQVCSGLTLSFSPMLAGTRSVSWCGEPTFMEHLLHVRGPAVGSGGRGAISDRGRSVPP